MQSMDLKMRVQSQRVDLIWDRGSIKFFKRDTHFCKLQFFIYFFFFLTDLQVAIDIMHILKI